MRRGLPRDDPRARRTLGPLAELRTAAGISRDGATALDIVETAKEYGLAGEGHLGRMERLDGLSVPAIVWLHRSHFAVLEGAGGGTFHLNDPASGRSTMTAAEFQGAYSGAALTFTRAEDFHREGRPFNTARSVWALVRHSVGGVWFGTITGLLLTLLGVLIAPLSQVFVNSSLTDTITR